MSPVILWFIGLAPILRVRSGFEPVGTTAVVLGSRRCSRGDSSGPTTTERVSAGWDARFVRPRRCSGIVQVPSRGNQGIPLATISSAILFRQAGLHCFNAIYPVISTILALDALSFFHVDGVDWMDIVQWLLFPLQIYLKFISRYFS